MEIYMYIDMVTIYNILSVGSSLSNIYNFILFLFYNKYQSKMYTYTQSKRIYSKTLIVIIFVFRGDFSDDFSFFIIFYDFSTVNMHISYNFLKHKEMKI